MQRSLFGKMKKTQVKELFANINKTLVSFVSIALFIMLGTAIFLGIGWSTTGFENTIDNTLNIGNMQDAEVFYGYGLSDDLLDDIKKLDDVETAEGLYSISGFFKLDGMKYQANVKSISKRVNSACVLEGKFPVKEGDIVVERYWAKTHGVEIGDSFYLDEEGDIKHLKSEHLKVVGFINSPQYINQYKVTYGTSAKTGVPYDCIIFTNTNSFETSKFSGYTSIVVRSKSLREYNTFDDEFENQNKAFTDEIQKLADDYAEDFNATLPDSYPKLDASVLGRKANAALGSSTVPTEIMNKVRYTLAFLFVLVGIFVCYSAISRIVFEQTVYIGTKKALGLSGRQVRFSYLCYAIAAVLIGSIFGDMLGYFIVERVILSVLAKNYCVNESIYYFSFKDAGIFFAIELILTTAFALVACNKVLQRKAIDLLKGENTVYGKKHFFEKWKLWERLPLLTKTIVNNFLNDKRRVFATLTGIVGSCSLLVCALILLWNTTTTKSYFVNNIATYDTIIYADSGVDDAVANIQKKLKQKGIESGSSFLSSVYLKLDDGYMGAQIIAYDNDDFLKQFRFLNDGKEVKPGDGIYISRAYGEYHELSEGDLVEIIDGTGQNRAFEYTGKYDYYLMRSIILMNAKTYEKELDKDYKANTIMFQRGDNSMEELQAYVENIDGFISVFNATDENNQIFGALISSITIVSCTFIVSSVLLAFIVLLNLMVMFVNEKKKELIVLMINGFNRKEVKRYIYSDTILLAVIGTIIGAVLGCIVALETIKLFSSDCVILLRHISIPICLGCMAITGILTTITCLIALKKVESFKLSDINEM